MKCSFEPCDVDKSDKAGFGLCTFHYGQRCRGLPLSMVGKNIRHSKDQICSVDGCGHKAKSKGFCGVHFCHAAAGKTLGKIKRKIRHNSDICAVEGCSKTRTKNKWCSDHYHYWNEYKLDPQIYEDILKSQGGVCAVCHNKCTTGRRLAVDHDHRTNVVRGLLCHRCNRAIGFFGDDPKIIGAAYVYLSENTSQHLCEVNSIRKVA